MESYLDQVFVFVLMDIHRGLHLAYRMVAYQVLVVHQLAYQAFRDQEAFHDHLVAYRDAEAFPVQAAFHVPVTYQEDLEACPVQATYYSAFRGPEAFLAQVPFQGQVAYRVFAYLMAYRMVRRTLQVEVVGLGPFLVSAFQVCLLAAFQAFDLETFQVDRVAYQADWVACRAVSSSNLVETLEAFRVPLVAGVIAFLDSLVAYQVVVVEVGYQTVAVVHSLA
jgi:hypothetical protein